MKLYDSLTGEKRDFTPQGDEVKMYVCGVTPYSSAHVGHAMSYIYFDTLRRYLEFLGYQVKHVQNFTDIDDKIITEAGIQGTSPVMLVEELVEEYLMDMANLNVQPAHIYPRVTDEIQKIIEMIEGLIEKGFAYESEGDVYYRVTKFRDYGKLSHRTLEGMLAGARVEPNLRKEHAMDFTLWKASKIGEPSWSSPWGEGRPGWHIECSAMAVHYLGGHLDIHGGGQDLVFPHHENEIAQTEAFTGEKPFVDYWVHNGLLQIDDGKMSKSFGKMVTVREALSEFSADAIRLFFLSSHYHSPLAYSSESIEGQKRAAERMRSALEADDINLASADAIEPAPFRERFIAAMDDDLNTPQALAALFDLTREINRGHDENKRIRLAQESLRELTRVLGLRLYGEEETVQPLSPFVELLAEIRQELRNAKQWELADRIRDRLQTLGISLEDGADRTKWRTRSN
ncbi:MAG: cysteine--tRNA ligase [Chloroflexota bacterium]|nr:cysteine--tRNA ligase [Chloroflexota bacterium]